MDHHVNAPTAALRTLHFAETLVSTCVRRHIKTVLTTSPVILLQPETFSVSHHIRSVGNGDTTLTTPSFFETLLFLWDGAGI